MKTESKKKNNKKTKQIADYIQINKKKGLLKVLKEDFLK